MRHRHAKTVLTYGHTRMAEDAIMRKLGAQLVGCSTSQDVQDVGHFDALLLPGGGDFDPIYYGQGPTHSNAPHIERDITEWYMIRLALVRGVPILGICRGHQWLAVACGGSLYQDHHHEGATKLDHYVPHKIKRVSPVLARHMPRTKRVNSFHHQTVSVCPPGFDVVARAQDGLIEAIYMPGYLGIQWHPEMLVRSDDGWMEIFRWFVEDGLK